LKTIAILKLDRVVAFTFKADRLVMAFELKEVMLVRIFVSELANDLVGRQLTVPRFAWLAIHGEMNFVVEMGHDGSGGVTGI